MTEVLYSYYTQFKEIVKDDNVVFLGLFFSSFPSALLLKYLPHPAIKQVIQEDQIDYLSSVFSADDLFRLDF